MAYLKAGNIFKAYEEFNAMALYSNTVAASKVGGLLMDTTVVTSWYKDKSGNLTTSAVRYELPDGSVKLPDGTPVTKDTPGAKEVKNAVALREDGAVEDDVAGVIVDADVGLIDELYQLCRDRAIGDETAVRFQANRDALFGGFITKGANTGHERYALLVERTGR